MTQQYSQNQDIKIKTIDICLLIASIDKELKEYFDNYICEEYKNDNSQRLDYIDISEIGRFILNKFKGEHFEILTPFFDNVETLLFDCDERVENLIVVGLFEGIQNSCGTEIDYHFAFNAWLKPISKIKWDNLIDSWERESWKTEI